MNIIFLGLMFDEDSLVEVRKDSKTGLQMAAHNFQNNLYKGFQKNKDVDLHIINVLPIGSFPKKYKRLLIESCKWGGSNIRIGFLNLPIIKKSIQERKIKKYILELLDDCDENWIIAYSLYMPFIKAADRIKKRIEKKNIHISLLQTDDVPGRNGIPKYDTLYKVKEANKMVRMLSKFDAFILLTRYLCEPLEIENKPWIVMEGVCDESQPECDDRINAGNIVFLYTGAINEEYGIKELSDAISLMKGCELWLCGAGDAVDYLKSLESEGKPIKYLGYMSYTEVQNLREQCDFLINPRYPTGTYTLYSFPSKTMEYMMTGKPTIMYKLEGIPGEYDEFLIYLSESSIGNPEKIKEELTKVLELNYEELKTKAHMGREFLIENKSCGKQAQKIIKFLERVND